MCYYTQNNRLYLHLLLPKNHYTPNIQIGLNTRKIRSLPNIR